MTSLIEMISELDGNAGRILHDCEAENRLEVIRFFFFFFANFRDFVDNIQFLICAPVQTYTIMHFFLLLLFMSRKFIV